MSSSFPTSLDSLTDPGATSKLNSPSHSQQHININDAVEKLEAKVGVNSSAVTTSHDYKLSGVTGTDKAVSLTGEETETNKTLTTPVISAIYQDAGKTKLMTLPDTDSDTLVTLEATQELGNKTLDSPVIKSVAGGAPTTAGQVMYDSTANQLKYGNGTTTVTVGQQYRAFSWYLDGTSIVANEVGAKYIVPQDMTVSKIMAKTTSGTATIRIQKDTTDVDASIAVTSSVASETSITAGSLTAGQVLSLDITAVSSCVGLTVIVECLQS
jgi:hypothetical protein